MKISQDIRADASGWQGLEQMSETFKAKGSAIYLAEGAPAESMPAQSDGD